MHQPKLLLLKYEQRLCIESTTPLEDKSLTFSFYISFEESASYKVYYRVNNL